MKRWFLFALLCVASITVWGYSAVPRPMPAAKSGIPPMKIPPERLIGFLYECKMQGAPDFEMRLDLNSGRIDYATRPLNLLPPGKRLARLEGVKLKRVRESLASLFAVPPRELSLIPARNVSAPPRVEERLILRARIEEGEILEKVYPLNDSEYPDLNFCRFKAPLTAAQRKVCHSFRLAVEKEVSWW